MYQTAYLRPYLDYLNRLHIWGLYLSHCFISTILHILGHTLICTRLHIWGLYLGHSLFYNTNINIGSNVSRIRALSRNNKRHQLSEMLPFLFQYFYFILLIYLFDFFLKLSLKFRLKLFLKLSIILLFL